jgi:hypothetical protein
MLVNMQKRKRKKQNIGICNDFLNKIPVVQKTIARIEKWNYIKL